MNCVPGDRAIIIDSDEIVNPKSAGRLCDVLHAAIPGSFVLPNGTPAFCSGTGKWVIELDSPMDVMWRDGILRETKFAVCPDSKLRPIRDQPGSDETLTWLDVPQKEVA